MHFFKSPLLRTILQKDISKQFYILHGSGFQEVPNNKCSTVLLARKIKIRINENFTQCTFFPQSKIFFSIKINHKLHLLISIRWVLFSVNNETSIPLEQKPCARATLIYSVYSKILVPKKVCHSQYLDIPTDVIFQIYSNYNNVIQNSYLVTCLQIFHCCNANVQLQTRNFYQLIQTNLINQISNAYLHQKILNQNKIQDTCSIKCAQNQKSVATLFKLHFIHHQTN
eukprot:TRINITY_DN16736_c0_g1_i4.p2 TRINITY_DN16736_c0_g1~~TRINITY_DN16736_c0_g1_i4.p2  ORF type:complete len:227 (-),score=-14.06 TRINITY_DN16736_c0_g1_i4:401-1081(-)